jgi:hypothetical protein
MTLRSGKLKSRTVKRSGSNKRKLNSFQKLVKSFKKTSNKSSNVIRSNKPSCLKGKGVKKTKYHCRFL